MDEAKKETRFVVLIKEIEDRRSQYLLVKRLHELWPDQSFSDLNTKVRNGEHIIFTKTQSRSEAEKHKRELESLGANVDIIEQKTLGGANVF